MPVVQPSDLDSNVVCYGRCHSFADALMQPLQGSSAAPLNLLNGCVEFIAHLDFAHGWVQVLDVRCSAHGDLNAYVYVVF